MRLLALETTGGALSAAAFDGERLLAELSERPARQQAERVLPVLDAARAEAGWAWPDVELLAVALGPGSFTGVRTGLAAARGLALAIPCLTIGVSSLGAMAERAAADGALPARPVLAIADARRGEIFVQRFDPALRAQGQPRAWALADAAALRAEDVFLVGDEAAQLALEEALELDFVVGARSARYVAAAARRLLAQGGRPGAGSTLMPLYGRGADAVPAAGRALVHRAG